MQWIVETDADSGSGDGGKGDERHKGRFHGAPWEVAGDGRILRTLDPENKP
jgi:hypothetical protein